MRRQTTGRSWKRNGRDFRHECAGCDIAAFRTGGLERSRSGGEVGIGHGASGHINVPGRIKRDAVTGVGSGAATAEFQVAASLFKVSEREGALAYAYAKSGKTAEARALLANFLRESKSSYVTWYGISFFYVGLGDKDEAFACLEKAYAQHDSRLRDVKQEPMPESLHSDPRFPRLVQRVGL